MCRWLRGDCLNPRRPSLITSSQWRSTWIALPSKLGLVQTLMLNLLTYHVNVSIVVSGEAHTLEYRQGEGENCKCWCYYTLWKNWSCCYSLCEELIVLLQSMQGTNRAIVYARNWLCCYSLCKELIVLLQSMWGTNGVVVDYARNWTRCWIKRKWNCLWTTSSSKLRHLHVDAFLRQIHPGRERSSDSEYTSPNTCSLTLDVHFLTRHSLSKCDALPNA